MLTIPEGLEQALVVPLVQADGGAHPARHMTPHQTGTLSGKTNQADAWASPPEGLGAVGQAQIVEAR